MAIMELSWSKSWSELKRKHDRRQFTNSGGGRVSTLTVVSRFRKRQFDLCSVFDSVVVPLGSTVLVLLSTVLLPSAVLVSVLVVSFVLPLESVFTSTLSLVLVPSALV